MAEARCTHYEPDHNGECCNCDEPLSGHEQMYLVSDGAITCLLCGRTSHHLKDVAERYCGNCHLFHDVVAEARRAYFDGATHDCGEWPTADHHCAICGRQL